MNIPENDRPFRELMQFKSRRNTVTLIQTEQECTVLKAYNNADTWVCEQKVYRLLQDCSLPHAQITAVQDRKLFLTQLPGHVLTELLKEQEMSGVIDWTVWNRLVSWLTDFHDATGLVMTDVNLRNFLYDPQTQTLYGVDFEECSDGSMLQTAGLLAAFIRNYAPENTPVKQQIADHVLQEFSRCMDIPIQALLAEATKQEIFLLNRRKNKIKYTFSERFCLRPVAKEDRRGTAGNGCAYHCVKEKP